MKEILNLKPEKVFKYFYELTQIPRASKKEAKVVEYVLNCAKKSNLEALKDKIGNVIVRIPANKSSSKNVIVLQAHLDMVCEKNSGIEIDFDKDGLDLVLKGNILKAKGTTLGADNGVGAAFMMALMEEKELAHPGLELLFTIDEEAGMTGANNLDVSLIKGRTLINLDTEDWEEFFIGCSGGKDTTLKLKSAKESVSDLVVCEITAKGFKGGHSGCDIEKNRKNAIKLLVSALSLLRENFSFKLASISGGNKRNAIPREAGAIIAVKGSDLPAVSDFLAKLQKEFYTEFGNVEPEFKLTLEKCKSAVAELFSNQDTLKIISFLTALPNGIQAMSPDVAGLVETSTNLGVVTTEANVVEVVMCNRSSVESSLNNLCNNIHIIGEFFQAEIKDSEGYPGWKPDLNSAILKKASEVFEKMYGKMPKRAAVHAGLECGILGKKFPGMDMISIGPTIRFPHSPDEECHVNTVNECYNYLKTLLESLAR